MQKTYCDMCGKEITPNMLPGGCMRNKESFPVFPILSAENPGLNEAIKKQILQEIWELCEDCQKWLWGQAEKRREELMGKKEDKPPKSKLVKS